MIAALDREAHMAKVRAYFVGEVMVDLRRSDPPRLVVAVTGLATSSAWAAPELRSFDGAPSPSGILDLELVAEPSAGISLPAPIAIAAVTIWEAQVERIVGVKVHARANDVTRLVR
jgi:hypothetical protein